QRLVRQLQAPCNPLGKERQNVSSFSPYRLWVNHLQQLMKPLLANLVSRYVVISVVVYFYEDFSNRLMEEARGENAYVDEKDFSSLLLATPEQP
ncbi:MAG: hypothetical protein ACOYJW_04535, partial [Candidatus Omnitrophota bacterium]